MSKETIEATVTEHEFAKADWAAPDVADEKNGHPAPPPPPAPVDPVDYQHVHRKLMRLLNSLEQTGTILSDEVHRIRAHP
jgi:hypothetical protein